MLLPIQHDHQPPSPRQQGRQQRWWRVRPRLPDCLQLWVPSTSALRACVQRIRLDPSSCCRVPSWQRLRWLFFLCAPSFSSSSSPAIRTWRTQAQLAAWQAKRTRRARRAVALHWSGTLAVAALCGLDSRFREAVAAVLDYYIVSLVMTMAFFAIVAHSDPGFLPLPPLAPSPPPQQQPQQQPAKMEEGRAPAAPAAGGSSGATGAGDVRLIPETEEDVSSSSSSSAASSPSCSDDEADDAAEAGAGAGDGEDDDEAADAEVRGYTSPSRDHGNRRGHRMRAWTVVDPLLGRADVQAAERVPGVRAWLRRRHCRVCGLDRLPIRTRHCDDCGRCVARFDHHSRALLLGGNCVGAGNHCAFLLFLLFQCLHLTLALALLLAVQLPAFLSTYLSPDRNGLHHIFLLFLQGNFPLPHLLLLAAPEALLHWPLPSLLVLGVGGLWGLAHGLLLRQLKVVVSNRLTAEATRPHECPYLTDNGRTNPFDRGCGLNVLSFCALFYQFNRERQEGERRRRREEERRRRGSLAAAAAAAAREGGSAQQQLHQQQQEQPLLAHCPSSSSSASVSGAADGDMGVEEGALKALAVELHSLAPTPSTRATTVSPAFSIATAGTAAVATAGAGAAGGRGGSGGSFLAFFRRKFSTAAVAPASTAAPSSSSSSSSASGLPMRLLLSPKRAAAAARGPAGAGAGAAAASSSSSSLPFFKAWRGGPAAGTGAAGASKPRKIAP